jgi:ornithine cyclodeaminase/alanine dehydrogenase
MAEGTLLLSRTDVAGLLSAEEYLAAVEHAFRLHGEGKTAAPGILGVHASDGGFHIKAGILDLGRSYFAAKINANFPQNVERYGLPLIQGVIVLADAENGSALALMDSMEITLQRTGAATAVAAKYLARPDSRTLTICGCGNQGRVSLEMLSKCFKLEQVFAFDIDSEKATAFARIMPEKMPLAISLIGELEAAVKASDIVVTCTPATHFFLNRQYVSPGLFVAAVGADSELKQELEPGLLAHSKIVVDILDQCRVIGELHHALVAGVVTTADVHAELGEVVAGVKPGRTSAEEIIIFDSTGMALQDVIAAATVYEKAAANHAARTFDFAD